MVSVGLPFVRKAGVIPDILCYVKSRDDFENGAPERARRRSGQAAGTVTATRVGGRSVMVCDGHLLS